MVFCTVIQPVNAIGAGAPDSKDIQRIAKDAYLYGFPMVMNYKTMYQYAIDTKSAEYKGAFNQISCDARLFTPQDKAVVTPNSDTPYCMFWMDLRSEPLVLSVPAMEERYYSFQLIDLYTHNFAYVGTLTTGNQPGRYLLAGPGWKGATPEGVTGVLRAETDFIFNVTRTQLFGAGDLGEVKRIQAQYQLQPLSAFLGIKLAATPPALNFPGWEEGAQFDERFFLYLDFMMDLLKQPGKGESALWQDLARLEVGPGKTFALKNLASDQVAALQAGIKEGMAEMKSFVEQNSNDPTASGKWFGTREFLSKSASDNYKLEKPDMLRAVSAYMGLYGNSAAEATYPTYLVDEGGEPLIGTNKYRVKFPKGMLPPVRAFWSLTMYDGKTQLLVDNPLHRFLLNSNMESQFVREPDGSLVLYVGHESPGANLESNWLPAPAGPFYMVMRLYGPKDSALKGEWIPPKASKL